MRFLLVFVLLTAVSCSQKIYIVRHAEKAVPRPDTENMFDASNPPLSQAGTARAQLLKNKLSGKKIRYIYTTKYTRNVETAEPLAAANKIQMRLYSPDPNSLGDFIDSLKSLQKGNILVVGHSNTVDDLVNKITGEEHVPKDLDDTEYDNLFIITKKKGLYTFKREKFGDPGGADKK